MQQKIKNTIAEIKTLQIAEKQLALLKHEKEQHLVRIQELESVLNFKAQKIPINENKRIGRGGEKYIGKFIN